MSRDRKGVFVIDDTKDKLENLTRILEKYHESLFTFSMDQEDRIGIADSLLEAIKASHQIASVKEAVLWPILPRLINGYKIIKDERSVFTDAIADIIVLVLINAKELDYEQKIDALQEVLREARMGSEESSILYDKYHAAVARVRETRSEVDERARRDIVKVTPVAMRREVSRGVGEDTGMRGLGVRRLRQQRGAFGEYPNERRRGADASSVINFSHQESDGEGSLDAEIAVVAPPAALPTAPPLAVRARPFSFSHTGNSDDEVAANPPPPVQAMQPHHGFFMRLLRRCCPDRRVIAVDRDDEGR